MSVFKLIRYIAKQKKLIVFITLAAFLMCTILLNINKSYTATIIIKYAGSAAKQGLTQSGKQINPYEIASAEVVKRAFEKMGIDSKSSIDATRRLINVTPIVPTDEEKKYQKWLDNFKSYDEDSSQKAHPIFYKVTYTSSKSESFTRDMLNSIIDAYVEYYGENYLYKFDVAGYEYDVDLDKHDYYEVARVLDMRTEGITEFLLNQSDDTPDFRSSITGYTLGDLARKYENLRETKLASVYNTVLTKGISKDKELLINTLQNDISGYQFSSDDKIRNAESAKSLMELYAEKNNSYLWTRPQSGEDGEQVTDLEYNHYGRQPTTVYDNLVFSYVDNYCDSENKLVDISETQNAIEIFRNNTYAPTDGEINEVRDDLIELGEEFNGLYDELKATLSDYNRYQNTQNVTNFSGIVTQKTRSEFMYYALTGIFGVAFGAFLGVCIEMFKEASSKMRRKRERIAAAKQS